MTLVAVVLVDRLGRRPLLLGGVSGMVLALLVLGSTTPGSPLLSLTDAELASGASVGALLLFVGCYQVSGWKFKSLLRRLGWPTHLCTQCSFQTC